jgi:hypothetical protein
LRLLEVVMLSEVVMLIRDNERSTGASSWSVAMCRIVEGGRVRKADK